MSKARLASIVINNYNYGRFLSEAIDSALNQTYTHAEVVVVDDGSTDNSRDVIAKYSSRVVAVLKENGGQASAFNAGVQASRGEIIVFLDSDDKLLPTAVARAVESFDDPRVVKAHWPLWRIDGSGRMTGEIVPHHPLPEGDLRGAVVRYGPEHWGRAESSPLPSGHAWSRGFLERVFPIPEAEYKSGADYYLIVLAPIFGLLRSISEPQGCYRVHGSNDTLKPLDEYIDIFFRWYEHSCSVLSRHLRDFGINVDAAAWPRDSWFHRIHAAIQDIVALVPPTASLILVDQNQWGTSDTIAGRARIPFLERDGQYWGPPADDAAAIRELERLRHLGVSFIVFAWPAFWWLDHYSGLHQHLQARYRRILVDERLIIFSLQS